MRALRRTNDAQALEAEVLQALVQGSRLAETERIPPPFCIYCGFAAEASDHVIPVSRQTVGRRLAQGPFVPACFLCNTIILNRRLFPTFRNRLAFVGGWYERRLKGRSAGDLWSNEEIAELGYGLKTAVLSATQRYQSMQTRLWWNSRLLSVLSRNS